MMVQWPFLFGGVEGFAVDGGLSFGDGAVVKADFVGKALEQDALDGFGVCCNHHALSHAGGSADDLDRGFDCGIAIVGEVYGYEVGAGD